MPTEGLRRRSRDVLVCMRAVSSALPRCQYTPAAPAPPPDFTHRTTPHDTARAFSFWIVIIVPPPRLQAGATPLLLAAKEGRSGAAAALLKAGADKEAATFVSGEGGGG